MANHNAPIQLSNTIPDLVAFHDEDYYLETVEGYQTIFQLSNTIPDLVAFHDEDYYLDGPSDLNDSVPLHFGFEI